MSNFQTTLELKTSVPFKNSHIHLTFGHVTMKNFHLCYIVILYDRPTVTSKEMDAGSVIFFKQMNMGK